MCGRKVVLEFEHARALLKAPGGYAVDVSLAHGDTAHLADPFVVPAAVPLFGVFCYDMRYCRALVQSDEDRADGE